MRYQVEEVAAGANLRLSGSASWSYCEDWPHISTFRYELSRFDMDSSVERWLPVGVADGYRIAHDWTVESSLALLDEADALDEDITTYIQSLMNELSAYDRTYGNVAGVTAGQRVILLRHVEPAAGEDVTRLWSQVTASLAMMDAPVFMLVDPQEMPVERETAAAKLTGAAALRRCSNSAFRAWSRLPTSGLGTGTWLTRSFRRRRTKLSCVALGVRTGCRVVENW